MKKEEKLAAFEDIDPDILWGRPKNKEIVKLFLKGLPTREIAEQYGLSVSRIGQIVARQARRANFYKTQKNDPEYQVLVEEYVAKMMKEEPIEIHSDRENKSKSMMAISEAGTRLVGKEGEPSLKSYIIRIELQDSNPLIWRRVIMPAGATFNRLHDVIQNVTNFKSGYPYDARHIFNFELREENISVTSDDEAYQEFIQFKKNRKMYEDRLKTMPPEYVQFEKAYQERLKVEVRKPKGLKIDDYLEKYKEISYNYDFGDGWQFIIKLEDIVDDYYFGFPTLLDGAETAPPEDVGGLPGFYEFLNVYRNENHPEHKEIVSWAKEQRFREYDPEWINVCLKNHKYRDTHWDRINHENYRIIKDKYRKK